MLFRPAVGYTQYREYRLFRKRPDLRFRGIIHESLVPDLDPWHLHKGDYASGLFAPVPRYRIRPVPGV